MTLEDQHAGGDSGVGGDTLICFCCGKSDGLRLLATADFYVPGEQGAVRQLPSRLFECRRCDLVVRDLDYDDSEVLGHYEVTSYTSRRAVDEYYRQRINWFRWFTKRTIERAGTKGGKLLDFGCSYGHLMDCFIERGWEVKGVEISASAIACLSEFRPQYDVVPRIEEVRPGWADVVVSIDSLYCVERPDHTIRKVFNVLRRGGTFAGRVAQRNFHYRINAWWQRRWSPAGRVPKLSYALAGDAKTGFSRKSLKSMLGQSGFRETVFATREPGKRRPLKKSLMLEVLWAVNALTFGLLSTAPGLQFWCIKPKS